MNAKQRHALSIPIETLIKERRKLLQTGENMERVREINAIIDEFNFGILIKKV